MFTDSCNRLSVSQTVSVRVGKNEDQLRGFINNKQEGWSFPVDVVSYYFTFKLCILKKH